jgi:hypothetical protein
MAGHILLLEESKNHHTVQAREKSEITSKLKIYWPSTIYWQAI